MNRRAPTVSGKADQRPTRKARRKDSSQIDPRAVQASEAVLGSILLHAPCMAEVDLLADEFQYEWQRVVYAAMLELHSRKVAIDVVTVADHLQAHSPVGLIEIPFGETWIGILSMIASDTPTWRNVGAYAKIVRERAVARKAEKVGLELAENIGSDAEAMDTAIKELMQLGRSDRHHSMRISEAIAPAVEEIDALATGSKKVGLPTGFSKLDTLLGGLSPEHLIIIGARPAMGKTTMGMQLLLNNPKIPTGFMSTEMPASQIVQRAIGTLSGVSTHAMRLGRLQDADWPKISTATGQLAEIPIWLNDSPSPTPFQVYRQARQWKWEHDIKLLVVDYIQHLKLADVRDKTPLLSEAVVGFKELARELKIPVVLLAQINRSVESRSDKRPNLGDYKDTGALEEEADVVLSLYRHEVYEPKTIDEKGKIEIAALKHRHGPTGWFKAHYNAACLRIEDIPVTPDAF